MRSRPVDDVLQEFAGLEGSDAKLKRLLHHVARGHDEVEIADSVIKREARLCHARGERRAGGVDTRGQMTRIAPASSAWPASVASLAASRTSGVVETVCSIASMSG